MNFDFYKMHGSGNDFIIVDNIKNRYTDWSPDDIRELCQRHTGIGADGLLLLEDSANAQFRMRYFNSDGYESSMCANGARCISYLAYKLGLVDKKFVLEASDGLHHVEVRTQNQIKVQLNWSESEKSQMFPVDFDLPNSIYYKKFINTGVPHLVLHCKDVNNVPVNDIGKKLRYHPCYQPEGTNVNFVEVLADYDEFKLKIRTYERGVERETLSCGTGVAASALSFLDPEYSDKQKVAIDTKGGKLYVYISQDRKTVLLEGPAIIVYKGIYVKEEDS
jgi:diaminopimelate epimerase